MAIASVAQSSGRQVVELKLTQRLKDDKLKEGKIEPEQVDEVELPKDEKSSFWKFALINYTFAAPLVLASPIMFAIFHENMFKGEVCKFYELADSTYNI